MPHSPLRARFPARRGPGSVGIATTEPESIGSRYRELEPTIVRRRPSAHRSKPGAGSSSPLPASSPLFHPHPHVKLSVLELANVPRHFRSQIAVPASTGDTSLTAGGYDRT